MENKVAESEKPFTPINNLTKWILWIFLTLLVLNVVAVLSGYAQAELLIRAIGGGTITEAEAAASDSREAVIGILQVALYIASGIVFLMWVYRAYRNLYSFQIKGLRFTPGWAVGWFFVPIVSLYRPYQVVSEIWKASNANAQSVNTTSWQTLAASPIIGWWWAFFLISNILAQVAARLIMSGEELSELLTSTYFYMASDTVDTIGIVVTMLMVRKLSQSQETKFKLTSSHY